MRVCGHHSYQARSGGDGQGEWWRCRHQRTPGGGGWIGIRIRVRQGVVGRDQSTLGGGGQGSEYIRQGVVGRGQSMRAGSEYARGWWAGIRVH